MNSDAGTPLRMASARITFHVSAASGHSFPPRMGSVFADVNTPFRATPSRRPFTRMGIAKA
jgi:hypothetical protein